MDASLKARVRRRHPCFLEMASGACCPVVPWFAWRRIMWADGGHRGPDFAAWVRTHRPKLAVEVVRRCAAVKGFKVLPRRWVGERTFGWLTKLRRLVRDHEQTESRATAMLPCPDFAFIPPSYY